MAIRLSSALRKGGLSDSASPSQLRHSRLNRLPIYDTGIKRAAIPFEHPFALAVPGLGDGFKKLLEAHRSANVLGWCSPLSVEEARIGQLGVSRPDFFDRDGVLPVVAEVVDVGEGSGPPIYQRRELCGLGATGVPIRPLRVGYGVADRTLPKLEEVIVLEWHRRLDHLMKEFEACGKRHLDGPPDGRLGVIQRDTKAGDATRLGHTMIVTRRRLETLPR